MCARDKSTQMTDSQRTKRRRSPIWLWSMFNHYSFCRLWNSIDTLLFLVDTNSFVYNLVIVVGIINIVFFACFLEIRQTLGK